MIRVMFLCTGNSCRSQMAEGFARELGKARLEAYSAGIIAAGVNPRAIAVMKEAGIDISGQKSKEIDERLLRAMDIVITLCDNAADACPWTPPQVKLLHWPVKDPVGTSGSEKKIMKEFRRARDEIREKIELFLKDTAGHPEDLPSEKKQLQQGEYIGRIVKFFQRSDDDRG